MKSFLKTILASMIGTFISLGLLFFVAISVLLSFAVSLEGNLKKAQTFQWAPAPEPIQDSSVLKLVLNGELQDHASTTNYSLFSYRSHHPLSLYEITQTLRKASQDKRIKGLLIEFKNFQSGPANAESLRREIVKFKDSGKFVITYAENYDELDYIVASAASEVSLYPIGLFEWNGLATKLMYFKNSLSKLEITPQVFRAGRYKSAIEPFTQEKMSEASREQANAILNTHWQQILRYAKEKTKLSLDELHSLAKNKSFLHSQEAKEMGFIDRLNSKQNLEKRILELTKTKGNQPLYTNWRSFYRSIDQNRVITTSPSPQAQQTASKSEKQKEENANTADEGKTTQRGKVSGTKNNKVALIFLKGSIWEGEGPYGNALNEDIYSDDLSKMLNEIRDNEDIKAVVLRVNSPGGSALASDVIWTATQSLKEKKVLVSSFGNVAASGGYYISSGSQYIFSEASTITGSIGVFGVSFATEKFFNEKLGTTFDTVKTHPFADIESLFRPFNNLEKAQLQSFVDSTYKRFLEIVTLGRPTLESEQQSHEVAQGRVWIGEEAQRQGLVDELGGLEDAIAKAVELAQLDNYSIDVYPKEAHFFGKILHRFTDMSSQLQNHFIPNNVKKLFTELFKKSDSSSELQIYTRLPFDLKNKDHSN